MSAARITSVPELAAPGLALSALRRANFGKPAAAHGRAPVCRMALDFQPGIVVPSPAAEIGPPPIPPQ
jgi:hypothetical protein